MFVYFTEMVCVLQLCRLFDFSPRLFDIAETISKQQTFHALQPGVLVIPLSINSSGAKVSQSENESFLQISSYPPLGDVNIDCYVTNDDPSYVHVSKVFTFEF